VEIPVWLTGINRSSVAKLTQVFVTDAVGFSSEEKEIEAPAGILRRICTGFCTRWNGLSALSSVMEISWKKRTLYGRISHRRI